MSIEEINPVRWIRERLERGETARSHGRQSVPARDGQRLVAFYGGPLPRSPNGVGVDLVPIARAGEFVLTGPAVAHQVYVTHPRNDRQLILFADYDEELARDKLNEALRVFTKLGAARIVATSRRQEVRRAEGRFGPPQVRVGVARQKDATWTLALDQRGTGGSPVDPRPLRYRDEPGFDAVCEGVLRLGVQRGRIEITRSSQFDVDGELAAQLRKAKFQLGFGAKRSQITEFVIEAAFTSQEANELDHVVAAAQPELEARLGLLGRLGKRAR